MKPLRYVPIERIIENVRRDFDLVDNINISDVLEWTFYSMGLIGADIAFIQKTTDGNSDIGHPPPIEIEHYRGTLPTDIYKLNQVREYTTGRAMRASQGSFITSKPLSDARVTKNIWNIKVAGDLKDSTVNFLGVNIIITTSITSARDLYDFIVSLNSIKNLMSAGSCTIVFNNSSNSITVTSYLNSNYTVIELTSPPAKWNIRRFIDTSINNLPTDLTYIINNSQIFANFEEGYVEVSYLAFPTDLRGYPVVPDDAKYIKAVESYIIERLARREFINNRLAGDKYKLLEQEWLWYCGSAKNSILSRSIDEMESMKREFTKLFRRTDLHESGYEAFGQKEELLFGRKDASPSVASNEVFRDEPEEIIVPVIPVAFYSRWSNKVCIETNELVISSKWINKICVQEEKVIDLSEIIAKWNNKICVQTFDSSAFSAGWINKICVQTDNEGAKEVTTFYVSDVEIGDHFILSSINKTYVFWFGDSITDAPVGIVEGAQYVEVTYSETLLTLLTNIETAVEALADFNTAVRGTIDETGIPFYPITITATYDGPAITEPNNGDTGWNPEPLVVKGIYVIVPSFEASWISKICVQEVTPHTAKWISKVCVQELPPSTLSVRWVNKICVKENIITLSAKWYTKVCAVIDDNPPTPAPEEDGIFDDTFDDTFE